MTTEYDVLVLGRGNVYNGTNKLAAERNFKKYSKPGATVWLFENYKVKSAYPSVKTANKNYAAHYAANR